ncbi:hypothetical protein Xen7305DRAFT_00028890 [Xenococcus sp. PCC 7305]|nr:hypothetical protein Xen7305DRAFT_00028890 [Xenococcus sp. PCC 7305]
MAIICDELKMIYLLAPGTGSSALSKFLIDTFGGKAVPESEVDVFSQDGQFLLRGKHCTYKELLKNNMLNKEQSQYLVVTGVRNPFEYLYAEWYRSRHRTSRNLGNKSSWIYNVKNSERKINDIIDTLTMDFSEWIEKRYKDLYGEKKRAFLHSEYIHQSQAYIRKEEMNQDLEKIIAENCGKQMTIKVPKVNVSRDRDASYWRHYSAEAREIIEYIYQPYLRKFSYYF